MQFSVAGEAWSGRSKVVGVLGNLLTSQQIRRQRDWIRTRVGFIIVYPPHPGFVSVNWTDNRRFYSLLNHHQLEIRQMNM